MKKRIIILFIAIISLVQVANAEKILPTNSNRILSCTKIGGQSHFDYWFYTGYFVVNQEPVKSKDGKYVVGYNLTCFGAGDIRCKLTTYFGAPPIIINENSYDNELIMDYISKNIMDKIDVDIVQNKIYNGSGTQKISLYTLDGKQKMLALNYMWIDGNESGDAKIEIDAVEI